MPNIECEEAQEKVEDNLSIDCIGAHGEVNKVLTQTIVLKGCKPG